MSLLLDDSNFDALFIDGKTVNKMFFKGEEIYGRYFAVGNKFTKSNFTTVWGSTNQRLYPQTDTTNTTSTVIGNRNNVSANVSLCTSNSAGSLGETLFSIGRLKNALPYMSISSFAECANVYYVSRFYQNTYDGDLTIKPYVVWCVDSYLQLYKPVFGENSSNRSGIGNKQASNTNEGLSFTYPASAKGRILQVISKLDETMVSRLNYLSENNDCSCRFLCKAFKTDDSTNVTTAAAYFGGYLLFEM